MYSFDLYLVVAVPGSWCEDLLVLNHPPCGVLPGLVKVVWMH